MAVSKCYIIMMEEENFELLLMSSQSSEQQLARLISYIFSNEHLYVDASFRHLIELDRKGFVNAYQLLKLTLIQHYFEDIELTSPIQQLTFLRATVVNYCPHLHYSQDRVRRLDPWSKQIILGMKPVCLTEITEPITVSDIRHYFGDDCFTTATKILPNTQKPVLVYTKSALEMTKALNNSSAPFTVVPYYDFCRARARDSRILEASFERAYRPLQFIQNKMKEVFMDGHDMSREVNIHQMHQRHLRLEQLRSKKHRARERGGTLNHIQPLKARNYEAEQEMFQLLAKRPNPDFNGMLQGVIGLGQLY